MKKYLLLIALIHTCYLAQSQSWNITGNGNTNPAIHFLGTTNNQPLKFRMNNRYAGEIDSITGKTFFGYGAGMRDIGTGIEKGGNSAFGYLAFHFNTDGKYNTAVGRYALHSNIAGNENTAIGNHALSFNLADYNTAIGSYALRFNTTGRYNTAGGRSALSSNTTGNSNTAFGNGTLDFNRTGSYNTASGYNAMSQNNTGNYNTASGYYALYYNNAAWYNTAMGSHALYFTTTGERNTAIGSSALYSNGTGGGNTAVGTASLYNTTASFYNTVIGHYAGYGYNMGWNNTILGANSSVNAAGLYNCIAIGQDVICTASSQARIGNYATNSIGGYANWTNISDSRYKKDINANVKGLEFIMKLQPVTYHLDISGLAQKLKEGQEKEKEANAYTQKAIAEKEKVLYSGFVAQDVEKAAKEAGYEFSGVDKPQNEKDLYGLRYAEFVVPLVKAVQEQQQMIDVLKKQNEELRKEMNTIKQLVCPDKMNL